MRSYFTKVICFALPAISCFAQQPQTQTAPISAINAKYVNGAAPGYWPTAGSGLTLNVSSGTAFCSGAVITYAGGTLTMTASTTNYVYLNTASSCAPAVKTSTFTSSDIPVAQVVTSGSAITSISDVRTLFQNGGGGGGAVSSVSNSDGSLTVSPTTGAVVASLSTGHANTWTAKQAFNGGNFFTGGITAVSGSPYTVSATDENKIITQSYGSASTINLPAATTSGFGAGAIFNFAVLGTGAATITPTTSTINGASTLVLTQGESAIVWSDGTNYSAQVMANPTYTGFALLSPAGNQTFNQATSSTTPIIVNEVNNVAAPGIRVGNGFTGNIDLGQGKDISSSFSNEPAIYMANSAMNRFYAAGTQQVVSGWGNQNSLYLEGTTSYANGALSGDFGNVWLIAGGTSGSLSGTPRGLSVMIVDAYLSSSGTQLASGNITCVGGGTTTYDVQNCPTSATTAIGVSVVPLNASGSPTTYVQSHGITVVNLDTSQSPVVGDYICTSSTTAGLAHDNSTTPCTTQQIGYAIQGGTSVTSIGITIYLR